MSDKKEKKSSLWQEFKAFVSKGNVVDMAIGVIIGAAFSAIVTALANGILMPIITMAVPAGLDGLVTVLNPEAAAVTATTDPANIVTYWDQQYDSTIVNVIDWGTFINAIIYFIIVAVVLFVILKVFTVLGNKRKQLEEKIRAEIEKSKENNEEKTEEKVEEKPAE